MERYLCIHGHFYQPPRENPWLEAIEIQDSAYPYHDWNERITAECYAPNSASRILDGESRIMDIVNTYARINFNFGPTLFSWMESYSPDIYRAILDADKKSIEWRSGHGNAIAQVYNHIIMPLANARDKRTQIIWGIRDFEHRFNRFPEGMWLSETAVDMETLEILAGLGIKYTILAPHQASRVRKIGTGKWKDLSGGRIDPSRAYLCKLPSGKRVNIFFYDGPISHALAFENILSSGEDFVNRLMTGFSDERQWTQLLNIATDGETYGHHHKFGDMALAYALNYIEGGKLASLTNYGEYLEKFPPSHEVQILENSSWSCIHGIERWRSNCGCNSGGHPEWNQEWRKPLRETLDWLKERLSSMYEQKAKEYLNDPWDARDDYIGVVLDRSEESINRFISLHAKRDLSGDEKIIVLKLMEMQRHAMMMYTSCGWFFDDLSGIETVQVIQYAGRAIQISKEIFQDNLETPFLEKITCAKSNISEHGDGAQIYEKFVRPAMIDLKRVGAHYAVSSIFKEYIDRTGIFSFEVAKEDYKKKEAGNTKLAIGRISLSSKITKESETISFCVLHLGNHDLNGGVRTFLGVEAYQSMKDEIIASFEKGSFADIVRLMDKHFGMHSYSLMNLFRDEQRKVLNLLIKGTIEELVDTYRRIYDSKRILMTFLQNIGVPVPNPLRSVAEFTLNFDIEREFSKEKMDMEKIEGIIRDIKKLNVPLNSITLEFIVRQRLEVVMERLSSNPSSLDLLSEIQRVLELLKLLPLPVNLWRVQNIYYIMSKTVYAEILQRARDGNNDAAEWVESFKHFGEMLFFNISSILHE